MPPAMEDIDQQIFEQVPEVKKLWAETAGRRRISLMLARMRATREYTQKAVAELANWDKGYVSRLESAQACDFPNLKTLARFAEACGMTIGLVVCDRDGTIDNDRMYVDVVDALALPSSDPDDSNLTHGGPLLEFDHLRGQQMIFPLPSTERRADQD